MGVQQLTWNLNISFISSEVCVFYRPKYFAAWVCPKRPSSFGIIPSAPSSVIVFVNILHQALSSQLGCRVAEGLKCIHLCRPRPQSREPFRQAWCTTWPESVLASEVWGAGGENPGCQGSLQIAEVIRFLLWDTEGYSSESSDNRGHLSGFWTIIPEKSDGF